MHAPLHRVAAAIAIVGVVVVAVVRIAVIVIVVVKCTEREPAPVAETAAAETIGCEGSTAKSTARNSG
jgi:hypothetical protein